MVKVCTSCLKALPIKYFGTHKHGGFGKKSRCKECLNIESKKYFLRNRVTVLEKNRKRYSTKKREYRVTANRWAKKNRDSCVARQIAWVKKNPQARKRYRAFNLKIDRPKFGCCEYCGERKTLTVDHRVPICRGGSDSLENISFVCRSCNSRKHSKTVSEFIEHSKVMGYKLIISNSK